MKTDSEKSKDELIAELKALRQQAARCEAQQSHLAELEKSNIPTRALVSWLVFEGGRLPGVEKAAVQALREAYEAVAPPGQGIIPGPPPGFYH